MWENRLPNIKIQLDFLDSDVYGFQELRKEQYDDLLPFLSQYDSVFQGRDGANDEGTPIFYKKEKFTLLKKGSYYLNEHPDTPGKGWDACCLRVASFVALKEKSSGKIFTYFNTHLDHVGKVAQAEGIKLMVSKMKEVGGSMLLSGDFNVYEDDVTYEIATEFLKDSKYLAKNSMKGNTFHNYGLVPFSETVSPIDYIMVSDDVKVENYKILARKEKGGYASDHYAAYADIEL
jgi:endonuclease/exonuclease/phosphatase family metal-dependent hydrolase